MHVIPNTEYNANTIRQLYTYIPTWLSLNMSPLLSFHLSVATLLNHAHVSMLIYNNEVRNWFFPLCYLVVRLYTFSYFNCLPFYLTCFSISPSVFLDIQFSVISFFNFLIIDNWINKNEKKKFGSTILGLTCDCNVISI